MTLKKNVITPLSRKPIGSAELKCSSIELLILKMPISQKTTATRLMTPPSARTSWVKFIMVATTKSATAITTYVMPLLCGWTLRTHAASTMIHAQPNRPQVTSSSASTIPQCKSGGDGYAELVVMAAPCGGATGTGML